MKIFLDTAEIEEIRTAARWGVFDGVTQAAMAGSHIATLSFKVLQQMVHHPLTDKGIVQSRKDWAEARNAASGQRS
jgi:transaldolase